MPLFHYRYSSLAVWNKAQIPVFLRVHKMILLPFERHQSYFIFTLLTSMWTGLNIILIDVNASNIDSSHKIKSNERMWASKTKKKKITMKKYFYCHHYVQLFCKLNTIFWIKYMELWLLRIFLILQLFTCTGIIGSTYFQHYWEKLHLYASYIYQYKEWHDLTLRNINKWNLNARNLIDSK